MLLTQYFNRTVNSIFPRNVQAGLLLAAIYVISGKLGLMLALPPGYASPIFPPAGIAIAAVLVAGRKMYFWIFLGALLLNLWVGYLSNPSFDTFALVVAAMIAVASLLQAAVGGWVLRKMLGYPIVLDSLRDILRFLLLSPLIALISASLSVGALLSLDVMQVDSFIPHWVSWWIGDTLGLMVMLPLTLTFIGQPTTLWRSRRVSVAVPMLAFFLLFILSFIKVNKWEYTESLSDFKQYSLQTSIYLQSQLAEQESLLEQMSASFLHDEHNNPTSRTEYQRFVKKSLQRHPMIQALSWNPRVSDEQRSDFEAVQRKDISTFKITERGTDGHLQPAATREFYYPVTYIEPLQGNEEAIGFDLTSNKQRQEAIEKSVQFNELAISAPIRLVQEKQDQLGVLLVLAISSNKMDLGVVISVLRMGDFINKLLPDLQPYTYTRIIDLDAQTVLFDNFEPQDAKIFYSETFTFGLRHFLLEMAPTPIYFSLHKGWQSWGVLTIGMLGISLLGALLLFGSGYTVRVKSLVEERTSELALSQKTAVKALHDVQHQKFVLDQHADVTITDLQGTIIYANKKFCEMSGYKERELLGQNHRIVKSGVHPKAFYEDIYKTIEAGQIWKGEVCNSAKNGELYWENTTIVPYLDAAGKPDKYIAIRTDITARVKMEEAVRESEYRWKFALEGAGDGVWDWDLVKGNIFFSRRWKEILGFTNNEINNSPNERESRIHPEDKDKTLAVLQEYLEGTRATYLCEYRMKCKDGSWKWILDRGMIVNQDKNAKPLRIIGTYTDITERKLNDQLVLRMAHYDNLTKLPNRALFNDRLHLALAATKRTSGQLALMFIDLDKFKPINDQYGHQIGDLLLQEVAKRMENCLRESDTVGRIGGDEFVILLPNIKAEQYAISVAQKIRMALNEPFKLEKLHLSISSSTGIAIYPQHGTDEIQLMKNADNAMYHAKESGRDNVILYTLDMQNKETNNGVNS